MEEAQEGHLEHLQHAHLNNFVKVFSAHSLKLVERLEEFAGKDKFDVFPFMNKSAVEITCGN
jgi:hypothetical protein